MASKMEIMQLCRLCLVKEQVNISIFDDQGDTRQIFHKISACLPVKISKEDNLPKKICDGCLYKLELLYQFWNTTTNAEKQLISWLNAAGLEVTTKAAAAALPVAPQVILKEEPNAELAENISSDAQSYIVQQQQLPYDAVDFEYEGGFPDDEDDSSVNETAVVGEPKAKRPRRAATLRASLVESEEEAEESGLDRVAKTEEESDDEEQSLEPAFVDVSESQDADQAGPSGSGKSAEAPALLEELKERFYQNLAGIISKKSTNISFFTRDKYLEMITYIKEIKKKTTGKAPVDYHRLKRFDVIKVGNIEKLCCPTSDTKAAVKFYICTDEMFDVIHETHMAISHGGRNRMMKELHKKFKNITIETVMLYLNLCQICQKRMKLPKKDVVVKPVIFDEMNSRCQVDLIDMQMQPDNEFKYILVYQDHLTKFVQLRPLKTKTPAEVAHVLLDIFTTFGAPNILQSENGREFSKNVVQKLSIMWPELKVVHSTCRYSQNFRAEERDTRDIENKLKNWLAENQTMGWSDGLRFVQFSINNAYQESVKGSPYMAMFGRPPKLGLGTSYLPSETLQSITTEEEFESVINNFIEGEYNEQDQNVY